MLIEQIFIETGKFHYWQIRCKWNTNQNRSFAVEQVSTNGGLDSKYTRKRKLFVAIFECQNRNLGEKVDCSHHIKFFHISSPSGDKYLKRDEKESFTRINMKKFDAHPNW